MGFLHNSKYKLFDHALSLNAVLSRDVINFRPLSV